MFFLQFSYSTLSSLYNDDQLFEDVPEALFGGRYLLIFSCVVILRSCDVPTSFFDHCLSSVYFKAFYFPTAVLLGKTK